MTKRAFQLPHICRSLVMAGMALISAAPMARAGLPVIHCKMDDCLVTCPTGDSLFAVRDITWAGTLCAGCDIVLDFSLCAGVVLPDPPPGSPYVVEPVGRTVLAKADNSGSVSFPLAAGGVSSGRVKVYASGAYLGLGPAVASFDQNGDLAVTDADLALVNSKIGTSDPTADFDCNHSVNAADYDIAAAHLLHFHSASPLVGVGDGPEIELGVRAMSNPSRGPVEFELRAPEAGWARLAIYDVSGRRLATVLDRDIEAGVRRVGWSGRDDDGRTAAAGLYFYRLTLGARQAQGALIVAR